MRPARLFLSLMAGATVIALLTAPGFAGAVAEKVQQVLVTNTASQPVPTQAVGTTQVGGTVAISGGSLTVDNDNNAPIPVDVQNAPAAPEPWQQVVKVFVFGGADNGFTSVGLPPDKLITVERIGIIDSHPLERVAVRAECGGDPGAKAFAQLPSDTTRGVDHSTLLHVKPDAGGNCLEVSLLFDGPVGSGGDSTYIAEVSLSGWSTPAPA